MARTPSSDKRGLKKGPWAPDEDRKLVAYVTRYGCWNWRQLPRFAGLARCGKSCRLRWLNYLRPNIKRGNYTEEEEEIIIRLHEKLGNKWSVIATHLPGRTDNEIKNHWHTTLKKRFGEEKDRVQTNENVNTKSNSSASNQDSDSIQNSGFFHISSPTTSKTSQSCSSSLQLSSSEFSSTTSDYATVATSENLLLEDGFDFVDACLEDVNENIWTESYVAKDNGSGDSHGSDAEGFVNYRTLSESPPSSCTENLVVENDFAFLEETSAYFWTEAHMADISLFPNELLAPLVNESDEYFSSMYDGDLWCQSTSHNLHVHLNYSNE